MVLSLRIQSIAKAVTIVALGFALYLGSSCTPSKSEPSQPRSVGTADDEAAITLAGTSYAKAWLSNDREAVLDTLTDDVVLMPSGLDAMHGKGEATAFWWPEGSPPALVTSFDMMPDDVTVDGDLAYMYGSFSLAFTYDGSEHSNTGVFSMLLHRQADGTWRIARYMWNDHKRNP
ncbi:MAG TPA: DUF4440 domain-containing protein [Fimbriimonadaceae bacterium]|nr:DUF4440 domain-containing protein [Fimbriimonadaceae bacterium]